MHKPNAYVSNAYASNFAHITCLMVDNIINFVVVVRRRRILLKYARVIRKVKPEFSDTIIQLVKSNVSLNNSNKSSHFGQIIPIDN